MKRGNMVRKMLPVILAAVFCLGVMVPAQADAAASPVGVVDYVYLIDQHPDTPKANEILRNEQEQARKEFADRSAGLGDKEKQELARQLDQRVLQKRQELLKPISDSINVAMKAVADAKGLTIVVHRNTVAMGGTDITEEVLKKLTGK
jgi:outer membrane protein